MSDTYTTLRGTRRAKTPAKDLYSIPHRHAADDGRVILWAGDLLPVCADCHTGHLQWAEAGWVSWHRICDTCGSHWDLHPLGMGIGYPDIPTDDESLPPSMRPTVRGPASQWVDGRGWVAIDPEDPVSLLPSPYRLPDVETSGRPWRELLALVTPEMIEAAHAERARTLDTPCVPACWARRARIYER